MAMLDAETVHVNVAYPFQEAYAFLSDPESFPKWASGLGSGLRKSGEKWLVEAPQGTVEVHFSEPNSYGVLDHWVHLPDGRELHIPLRVIPNGSGCLISLTLLHQPGTGSEQRKADRAWVERDLQALKRLLEETWSEPPRAPWSESQ